MASPPGSSECGAEKSEKKKYLNGNEYTDVHDCAEPSGHKGKHKCWCKKMTWQEN